MSFLFQVNVLQLSQQTTSDGTEVYLLAGPSSQWNLSYTADTFTDAASSFGNDIAAAMQSNAPVEPPTGS